MTENNQETITKEQLTNLIEVVVGSLVKLNNTFVEGLTEVGTKTTKIKTEYVAGLQKGLEDICNRLNEIVDLPGLSAHIQDVEIVEENDDSEGDQNEQ